MRCSALIGGPVAALLLAFGTAACAVQPASLTSAVSAVAASSPVLTSAGPTSAALRAARLMSVALASSRRGDGLFVSEVGAHHCEALSGVTADGGARFRSAALITSWNCNGSAPATWIAADSAGGAFAYGPSLYIASSPAGPWRKSPQPGTVLAVSAVGRSVWMLLALCRGAASRPSGCVLHLVESGNGGRTWQPVKSQPPGAVTRGSAGGPAYEPAAGQTWLLRADSSAAYVLAGPAVNDRGKPDSATFWYTANGGASWSRRHIGCGIDALSVSVARSPSGALVGVCADEPSAGFQVKTTLISSNGGRTWTLRAGCGFSLGCRDPLYFGYLGQVAAVSARTAFLVGDRSSLLATTDGGRRWHAVLPLVGDTSGGTFQVTFLSRSSGVVLGQGGATNESVEVFRTSDGGRTWSQVVPRLS
jgi:photosystem II stability/assembly factor-like uncharacterized protein